MIRNFHGLHFALLINKNQELLQIMPKKARKRFENMLTVETIPTVFY